VIDRLWKLSHREQYRKTEQRYRAIYPEKERARVKNRRAREMGSVGTVTAQEWEALKEMYGYTCLCCGKREPEIELTHDHVKPLAIGGENTISNSQPLCRSCNSVKGVKHIDYRETR
jgi:5-methylcytosine-specific restriction endonuclease McrA